MKPLSRRQLLVATVYSAILPAPQILSAGTINKQASNHPHEILTAMVDMILPADQHSPAASQLGVNKALWRLAERNLNLKKLLIKGCRWLDKESFGNFITLPDNKKIELLRWMDERASSKHLPGLFFKQVRYHSVGLYYATEQAQKELGLHLPPQPMGYPEIGLRDN